jgi:hypothetical protein
MAGIGEETQAVRADDTLTNQGAHRRGGTLQHRD